MSEWDSLNTYEQWKGKLGELLQDGRAASAANDDDARLRACARLREFVQHSRPNTPEILELDRLAAAGVKALSQEAALGALGRIESRTAELLVLAKRLDLTAAGGASGAASLRLRKVNAALAAITEAGRALADLGPLLRTGTDDDLTPRLKELLTQLSAMVGPIGSGV